MGFRIGADLRVRPLSRFSPPENTPLTPPHKGEGNEAQASLTASAHVSGCSLQDFEAGTAKSPSPLWGGVRGGG
ncbi:MAG: hypothetical protein Tsb0019_04640 [Roseibium sp.]